MGMSVLPRSAITPFCSPVIVHVTEVEVPLGAFLSMSAVRTLQRYVALA